LITSILLNMCSFPGSLSLTCQAELLISVMYQFFPGFGLIIFKPCFEFESAIRGEPALSRTGADSQVPTFLFVTGRREIALIRD
jgi:hypothetical protein